MQERDSISVKTVNAPETSPFTLKYFVTRQGSIYGIEVEKYLMTDKGELFEESESIDGITDKYSEIELLTKKLANNYVTPATLVNVVDDFISEFF